MSEFWSDLFYFEMIIIGYLSANKSNVEENQRSMHRDLVNIGIKSEESRIEFETNIFCNYLVITNRIPLFMGTA